LTGADGGHGEAPAHPTFRKAVRVWAKIGISSFGGPAGQISVMHRTLVDELRWISEARFLHALSYCTLLPGPEATQLATYIGWLLHGYAGGVVAGILFVLPGIVSILGLSYLYALGQGLLIVDGLFFGLKAAVLAVVVEAVIRLGKRVVTHSVFTTIAALSFAALFFWSVPFPIVIAIAAVTGAAGARYRSDIFVRTSQHAPAGNHVLGESGIKTAGSRSAALAAAGICLLLWFLPTALFATRLGRDHVLVESSLFFSKAAVVTFGGAYAVLAYISQQAVEHYGWLEAGEMLDGLGMAETTPGPLIMVVQFVGFMAAYGNPAPFSPLEAGVIGALLTTWVTFVPCFLWIFLGAPWVESLRGHHGLSGALSAITAAVAGVIMNLAVWFALHVLFARVDAVGGPLKTRLLLPDFASLDIAALVIAVASFVMLFRFRAGMLTTLGASAAAGVCWKLATAG
jgi:chromate transporter